MSKGTAVLVIDMQERYFQTDRPLAKERKRLTANIGKLLEKANQQIWPIYFTKEAFKEDFSDAPLVHKKLALPEVVAGHPLANIVNELGDYVDDQNTIIKKRHSSFNGTNLRDVLEGKKITDLIIVGINTDSCVLSACLDARMDYNVIIPRECVYSHRPEAHDIAMELLQYKANIMNLDELLNDE